MNTNRAWHLLRSSSPLRAIAALAGFVLLVPLHALGAPFPLSNPGFEGSFVAATECANVTGQVAPGWTDNTCWDASRPVVQYARDTVNAHSGLTSQKITLVSGNRAQFAQFLPVQTQAGQRNVISYWMRAQSPLVVKVMLRQSNAPYLVYASQLIKLTSAWQRYEFDALTPTVDSVLLILAETPGTFWIDDVDIQTEASALANPSPAASAVGRSFFGMHLNDADTPWPQVGQAIGAVRIWDAGGNRDGSGIGAQWSEINGAVGFYDWSGLDARVAAAAARNADVLYTLGGRTPQWAALLPNANSPYGPGQCSEPKSDQVWQDWVRAIATRYRGKIKFWEIWNEADLASFYCGRPERLVSLTQQAHAILKQVDPTNQLLTPSLAGFDGPGLLDFFFAQGGGQYVDIVSYHFYVDQPEEAVTVRVPNVKSMMRRYGLQGKPLWNTEQGWIDIPNAAQLPQATGAAYVARGYILAWAYGVSRYYYYTWDNRWNQFSFTQADRATLTPAGIAYREVAAWLTGKVMESVTVDVNGTYVVTLRDSTGQQQRILWNPRQSIQFAAPAAWGVGSKRDLAGAVSAVNPASIAVNSSPILLGGGTGPTGVEVILDNPAAGVVDSTGARRAFGKWCASPAANKYGADSLQSCGSGLDTYRWTPTLPSAGQYSVYLWWGAQAANSKSVAVTVRYAGGSKALNFDQSTGGGRWVLHGTYRFLAGKGGFVQLNDANGQAVADAVRFVRVP